MKRILLIISLLAINLWSYAQDSTMLQFAETITTTDLRKHLEIVASDSFGGRATGKRGQHLAAYYIKNHFEAISLQGPVINTISDNRYFQYFDIVETNWNNCTIKTNKKKLTMFQHFYPYQRFKVTNQELDVVFAGYGLDGEEYSDYEQLGEVTGKVVVLIKGESELSINMKTRLGEVSDAQKVMTAWEKGAALVILVHEDEKEFKNRSMFFKQFYDRTFSDLVSVTEQMKPGLLFTSPSGAAALLGTTKKVFIEKVAQQQALGKSPVGLFSGKAQVEADIVVSRIKTENVLGYLEGTDKKEELLVISAHYDHIGTRQGQIYNGADDDGSGTVAVMEMAEAFTKAAQAGYRPRRSILFITFTGEEIGLYGSEYYTQHPIIPLKHTVANLNCDMIGRSDNLHAKDENYVYVIGTDMLSTELHELQKSVNETYFPNFILDHKYNSKHDPNRFYYRSDHYNFAKHHIPIIFYFDGKHKDYHKPTDTVDKIDFEQLALRTKLIFCTAWQIANREERLKVDKAKVGTKPSIR